MLTYRCAVQVDYLLSTLFSRPDAAHLSIDNHKIIGLKGFLQDGSHLFGSSDRVAFSAEQLD
jgi:hypothetical protein